MVYYLRLGLLIILDCLICNLYRKLGHVELSFIEVCMYDAHLLTFGRALSRNFDMKCGDG